MKKQFLLLFVALLMAVLSCWAQAPDINNSTWVGWTDKGSSIATGVYARGGKVNDYQIFTSVFIYDTSNPVPGTSSGFTAGHKILGIGFRNNGGATGSPTIKLDPNNNSYVPSPDGTTNGQSSFSSNGDLGDPVMNTSAGNPQEITIRSANPYTAANDYYLPNGGNWGGLGQPGFRGINPATGVWKAFFDLDQMTAEFGPGGSRIVVGKPTLGAFGSTIAIAIGGLGGTEAVVGSNLAPPPSPPVHNITQNTYYTTISAGITAANANDVIEVAAGTYTESLLINKALTILGPNAAVSPNGGSRVAEATIDLTGGSVIKIAADNINLKGFKIQGLNQQGAIMSGGSLSGTTAADNITIEKNLFDNLKGNAIYTNGSISNWTITDNKIQNVSSYTSGGTYGSAMGFWRGANNITITNNTISNCSWEGIQFVCYTTSASNILVQNNTISNILHSGMNIASNLNNVDIIGNSITNANTSSTAIEGGIIIQGLGNVADAVISGNTISGSYNGIYVQDNLTGKGLVVNDNNLSGNSNKAINNAATGTLAATCNWYGSADATIVAPMISGTVDDIPYSISNGGSCTGYPPPTPGISLITKTLTPCGPFDVDVKVSDFKNIGAISLELDFASSVLDYLRTTSNGAVSSAIINEDLGHIVLGWNSQDAINLNDNDVLFTLHFAIKPAAVGGSTTNLVWDKANCEIAGIGTNRPIYTSTYNDLVVTIPARPVVLTGTGVHLEYCTIQAAIDAAVNGNTITVAAGTYPENVIVNKDVTLFGANAGTSCSGRAAESTIAGNGGTAVAVESDGVTIDGFEITNPTGPFAITATSRNNLLFQNNKINTIGTVGAVSNVHAIAIVMGSTNTDKVDILDNCISNIGNSGNGGSASGIGAGWSTATTNITNLVIAGNTVSSVNASRGAYGIFVNVGASASGEATGALIERNTVSALTGAWATAIALEGKTPGATVQNNLVSNLISTPTAGYTVAVKIEDNSGAASVGIHNNSFSGMSVGIYNASSGEADATCNWYGAGLTKIYGPVKNIPWLTSDVNTIVSPLPGFAPSVACVACTMTLSETHVNVACVSGTDGSINLTVDNGVAPLAYSWTGPNGYTSTLEDLVTLAAGTYNVTVTAANGCSATKQVVIGNADAEAPVITTCPPTVNLEGCSTAAITGLVYSENLVELSASAFTSAGGVATDNCAVASASYIDTKTGSCPIVVTRTWKVVDTNGNPSSTCEQTINIRDLTAPAITLPAANLSMTCFDAAQVDAWIATASATDVCSGPATVVPTYTAPTSSCNQTVVVTFKAKDACNNEATLTKSFTVNDNIAPELTVPANAIVDCPNPTTPATTGTATATDNCGTANVTYSDAAGQIYRSTDPAPSYDIQARARNGNTGFEGVLFTPGNPSPTGVQLNPAGTPAWNYTLYYNVELNYTAATGTTEWKIDFNRDGDYLDAQEMATSVSPTLVGKGFKYVGFYTNGNTASVFIDVQNLTINGTNVGSFLGAANGSATDQYYQNSVGMFTDITVTASIRISGNGGQETPKLWIRAGVPLNVPTPTACASNYVINRVWTATDACGNKSMKIQNIQVRDITAPTWLTQPGAAVTINCPATPVFTPPTATDGCDASPVITFTDVTVNGACAGTYTITRTWTAKDACGNASTTVSQAITVQDITAPVLSGQGADASIFCPAVPEFTAPTAADGCDGAPVITFADVTSPEGATVAPYSVTRTWTATDACGNHSSVSQTISVVKATLSGTMVYNNSGKTPISGVTLQLNPGGALVTTDADGKYSFAGLCTGDYTIAVTENIWKEGGVNSTDAGEVNSWSANQDVIEWVRFMSGDVNNDQYITSDDALKIQRKYVYRSAEPDYLRGKWAYWKQNETITSNELPARPLPTTIQVHVGGNVNNFDLYANCTGDFNGSFTPLVLKSTSSNLSLNNNSMLNASANQEFELPIRAASAMQVGAVSMSLNIPSNLVTVQDVLVNGSAVSAVWLVDGDELRIGWFSAKPVVVAENGNLITLKLKTTNAFTRGQTMEFALKFDPLNELANGENKVIPNASLLVAQVSNGTDVTGIISPFDNQNLSLSNYPNPFKGFTTVDYKLPVQGKVNITVYNQLGQQVQTLIDANQNAGDYSIRMDAKKLMPGIYIAKLRLTNTNVNMTGTVKLSVLK